jgi:von Willebrand factor type A domain
MTAPRLLLGALLVAALALTWPGRLAAQAARKAMYVSVVNDAGAPVMDLGIEDFIIREDNVTREVLRVEPALDPMQIAILVDNSTAARDNISHMRTALPSFVAALTDGPAGQKNEVSIIAIGERPTVLADYTTSRAALQKGIDRIWSLHDTGAYLLDGIPEVCQGFTKREATRPVIVALTAEAGPEFSNRQHDQVIEPLKATGAAFNVLVIGRPSSSLSSEARERAIVLDEGPRVTGGARMDLLAIEGLASRLKQLADQLMHQYKVTYARPQSLIPPERFTVATNKPGLTARGTLVRETKNKS